MLGISTKDNELFAGNIQMGVWGWEIDTYGKTHRHTSDLPRDPRAADDDTNVNDITRVDTSLSPALVQINSQTRHVPKVHSLFSSVYGVCIPARFAKQRQKSRVI